MMRRVVLAVVVACCVATIHRCNDAALDDAAGTGEGSHSHADYGPPMPPSMERICWACASVITTLIWIIEPVTV